MADKDFEQITVNDISDRANLNRGTFYLHFTDKYNLLYRCIEDHLNNMIEVCSAIPFM
ncbi:TetR/AcrR family transcriptional regulator [Paenibacillus sp. V4I5]|uniref:TetR/AcrR family transcriptional regulator n=1 Tax=Paenibacillus sp. V4I5 TaxID=3042306 RepID=UPI002794362F|nr:TetR/AcrR family transcriptional regulator [Paenibacillus sp. V4I5]MDQ0917037.1 AcrR family transcriptional regulator [Paenibacillus sp. V4I5]